MLTGTNEGILIYLHLFRYGLDSPIYINLVQDPVERFVSAYHRDREHEKSFKVNMKNEIRILSRCPESIVVDLNQKTSFFSYAPYSYIGFCIFCTSANKLCQKFSDPYKMYET